jgi:hypothetical protein
MCHANSLPCLGICKKGTDEDLFYVCNTYGLCCDQGVLLGASVPEIEGETYVPDDQLLNIE